MFLQKLFLSVWCLSIILISLSSLSNTVKHPCSDSSQSFFLLLTPKLLNSFSRWIINISYFAGTRRILPFVYKKLMLHDLHLNLGRPKLTFELVIICGVVWNGSKGNSDCFVYVVIAAIGKKWSLLIALFGYLKRVCTLVWQIIIAVLVEVTVLWMVEFQITMFLLNHIDWGILFQKFLVKFFHVNFFFSLVKCGKLWQFKFCSLNWLR